VALVAASAQAQEEKDTPRGPGEGIKVHGHWTIDVKNPDGSLASHHEFENALLSGGGSALSSILTHSTTQLLGWGIVLSQTSTTQDSLSVAEPAVAPYFASAVASGNLTVAASTTQPALVLQGSVQAPAGFSIVVVQTAMVMLGPPGVSISLFTGKAQTPPITVQPGQIIQVNVVLSFS
jgi:hypothetical protein